MPQGETFPVFLCALPQGAAPLRPINGEQSTPVAFAASDPLETGQALPLHSTSSTKFQLSFNGLRTVENLEFPKLMKMMKKKSDAEEAKLLRDASPKMGDALSFHQFRGGLIYITPDTDEQNKTLPILRCMCSPFWQRQCQINDDSPSSGGAKHPFTCFLLTYSTFIVSFLFIADFLSLKVKFNFSAPLKHFGGFDAKWNKS